MQDGGKNGRRLHLHPARKSKVNREGDVEDGGGQRCITPAFSTLNKVHNCSMLGKYESLDFEEEADFVALAENTTGTSSSDEDAGRGLKPWVLSLCIGLGTGIIGFLLGAMVSNLKC